MTTPVIWIVSMALGLGAAILAAASDAHVIHFIMLLLFSCMIAIGALRDRRIAAASGAGAGARAAITVRAMGLIWIWAATTMCLTYMSVLSWGPWLPLTAMLALGAGLCLFVAQILDREDAEARVDARIVNLVDFFAKAKLALACTAFGCLLAAGRASPAAFGGEAKWAALNILLTTALGLALLSAFAVTSSATDVEPATTA